MLFFLKKKFLFFNLALTDITIGCKKDGYIRASDTDTRKGEIQGLKCSFEIGIKYVVSLRKMAK